MGFKKNANPGVYFYLNLPFINMYFPYLISNTLKINTARVLEKKGKLLQQLIPATQTIWMLSVLYCCSEMQHPIFYSNHNE